MNVLVPLTVASTRRWLRRQRLPLPPTETQTPWRAGYDLNDGRWWISVIDDCALNCTAGSQVTVGGGETSPSGKRAERHSLQRCPLFRREKWVRSQNGAAHPPPISIAPPALKKPARVRAIGRSRGRSFGCSSLRHEVVLGFGLH